MRTLAETIRRDLVALAEAQNYGQMFDDVIKRDAKNEYSDRVKKIVDDVRIRLKKNDRIVWYLRWLKLGLIAAYATGKPALSDPFTPEDFENACKQYAKKSGGAVTAADVSIAASTFWDNTRRVRDFLEHYLSLPIPAIQQFTFGYQTPAEIEEIFEAAEVEWQKDTDDAFEDSNVDVIIDFKDGWQWVDTGRAYCSKEAAAMGHCGNEPRRRTRDRILSLRKIMKRGEKVLQSPHLTFILHDDGFLGEMKGRNNEKPSPEYHKMIIALLLNPIVEGIKGGGYLPENNFSIYDLPPDVADKLTEKKPELAGLWELYQKHGLTDAVLDMAIERLEAAGIETPDFERIGTQTVQVQEWRDVEHFAEDIDDEVLAALSALLSADADENGLTMESLSFEDFYEVINALNDREIRLITRHLGLPDLVMNTDHPRRAIRRLFEEFRFSDLYPVLLDVASENLELSDADKQKVKDLITKLFEEGFGFHGYSQWVRMKGGVDDPVILVIDGSDLVRLAAASEDDDDEAAHERSYIQEHGWSGIDWDRTYDRRKEEGLPRKEEAATPEKLGLTGSTFDAVKIAPLFIQHAFGR